MADLTVTAPAEEFLAVQQVLDQVPLQGGEAKRVIGQFQDRVVEAAKVLEASGPVVVAAPDTDDPTRDEPESTR